MNGEFGKTCKQAVCRGAVFQAEMEEQTTTTKKLISQEAGMPASKPTSSTPLILKPNTASLNNFTMLHLLRNYILVCKPETLENTTVVGLEYKLVQSKFCSYIPEHLVPFKTGTKTKTAPC